MRLSQSPKLVNQCQKLIPVKSQRVKTVAALPHRKLSIGMRGDAHHASLIQRLKDRVSLKATATSVTVWEYVLLHDSVTLPSMVRREGFEPPTHRSEGGCSIRLS